MPHQKIGFAVIMPVQIRKTDIEEIDRQHQKLLELLKELIKYAGSEFDFAASITAVTGLLDYTNEHFAYEETMLNEWGYEFLPEHKRGHAAFTAKVEELWKQIETDRVVSADLINLLKAWIVEHINEEDALYSAMYGA